MTFYHHSPSTNRASIKRLGLRLDRSQIEGQAISLTSISTFTKGFDTWAVDVRCMELEEDFQQPEDPNETWYLAYQDIAPSRLRLLAQ